MTPIITKSPDGENPYDADRRICNAPIDAYFADADDIMYWAERKMHALLPLVAVSASSEAVYFGNGSSDGEVLRIAQHDIVYDGGDIVVFLGIGRIQDADIVIPLTTTKAEVEAAVINAVELYQQRSTVLDNDE